MSGTALEITVLLLIVGAGYAVCLARIRSLQRKRSGLEVFSRKLLESQEKERERIAAELHGGLGQNLLIIKNRAELGLASATNVSAMMEQLREISNVCSEALEQARRTAHNLGPRHLEQLGLTEALDAMIDRVAASTNIPFERRLEPVDDLFEKETATNLYRIAQEALNNVMKHARASSASVQLIRDLKHVQLVVRDNGCGFEAGGGNGLLRNGGIGLAEISERVRILQGRVEIESHRGQGTTLTITIPFDEEKKSQPG